MNFPKELKYTKEHEWAKVEGDKVTIGITDHAQESLGEVVFCEFPEEEREVEKGESFGVVESVKAVSDLYAPLSGKVLKVNHDLEDAPEKVNESPYEEGWMVQMQTINPSELEELLSAEDYQKYVDELE